MSVRFRRLRHVCCFLPQIYSGTSYRLYGRNGTNILAARSVVYSCNVETSIDRKLQLIDFQSRRCPNLLRTASFRFSSVVSETKHNLPSAADIVSFVKSSLHQPESSFGGWMNTVADTKDLLKEDGTFLVLVNECPESCSSSDQHLINMFEKAKALQQRYPFLQVLTVLHSKTICLNDTSLHMLQRIIMEHIMFPILLTDKNILEMANGSCYIISKGFQDPLVYPEKDVNLKVLDQAIFKLDAQNMDGVDHDQKSTWVKPIEVVKEPTVCSASRNLLFAYPGCISVDEGSSRLFLSDVNHHRIIVFNSNGNLLDAIGSNPGFEDGDFENARLMRPAASFYNANEDSLYFVDSENHAIRRADMERRVVETVFPATDGGKENTGLWKWILDKIWAKRKIELKSDELNSQSFLFPWHLLKSPDNDLFVLSRSFGTLWIIDIESGLIKEVVKESSKILEICGKMILEKSRLLKQLPADCLQQQMNTDCSYEGIQYAALMSSAATLQDHVVFCDIVAQTVLKFSKVSGSLTSFQFSNFKVLGLPYWLSFPLEQVCTPNEVLSRIDVNHSQNFRLLPGRIDIDINVNIPQHADLVEPLQENCIWRQARGAAAEVSGIENTAASTGKVGVAQQWYDDLDNLAFTTSQEETNIEEEITPTADEVQDNTVCIHCTINTSPGSSEVIIYAALYLRLKKNSDIPDDSREKKAARLANILDPKRSFRDDLLVKLLTRTNRDLEERIFVKPLYVRLKFHTFNYPKADNSRDIILTDSFMKVNVNL